MKLASTRCGNHEFRQASGLCPSCKRPFCKECLTEHDGRLTCASCLRRTAPAAAVRGAWKKRLATPAMLIGGLLGSWLLFYVAGTTLEMNSAPAKPVKVAK